MSFYRKIAANQVPSCPNFLYYSRNVWDGELLSVICLQCEDRFELQFVSVSNFQVTPGNGRYEYELRGKTSSGHERVFQFSQPCRKGKQPFGAMQGDEVILVHACQGKLAAIANQSKGDWLCLRSPRYAARRFGTSVGSLLGAGGSMAALGVAGVVAGSTAALPALPAVAVLAVGGGSAAARLHRDRFRDNSAELQERLWREQQILKRVDAIEERLATLQASATRNKARSNAPNRSRRAFASCRMRQR